MAATAEQQRVEEELLKLAGEYACDPLGWTMAAFPWGEPGGPLEDVDEPDDWQRDELIKLGEDIRSRDFNGKDPVEPIRAAVASGHGIGKSAYTAILILFILTTRPMCRGVVTAVGFNQLRTKTWPELVKWHRMCLWRHWFKVRTSAQNLCIFHIDHPEGWRADGQSPAKENSEAFAGLHARTSSPFFIMDEASGIPIEITTVAQGGLTDGEPFFMVFGNPTKNAGFFKECFMKLKHRWRTRQIDSRTVRWTNKKLINQWVEDYGEDSDFVRVRVRGVFPRSADMQFFNSEQVQAAMDREVLVMTDDVIVLSCDVARSTSGDKTVIAERRGFDCGTWKPDILRTDDTMVVVSKIAERCERIKREVGRYPEAVFVDIGSMGAGVVDRLRQMGYLFVQGVNFGGEADWPLPGEDAIRVKNKRAEMYARSRAVMKNVKLWRSDELTEEMNAIEYGYGSDGVTLQIMSKEDIKKPEVLGYSPDETDAYVLLWAYPVLSKSLIDLDRNIHEEKGQEDWLSGWEPDV